MPIYEYVCDDCKKPYEKIVLSKDDKVTCPACGSARKTQQLSTFSAHSSGTGASATAADNFTCTGNPSACGCSRN